MTSGHAVIAWQTGNAVPGMFWYMVVACTPSPAPRQSELAVVFRCIFIRVRLFAHATIVRMA